MKDRRELLKGLAVGSVWSAPVVSSVALPVHANVSDNGSTPDICSGCINESGRAQGLSYQSYQIFFEGQGPGRIGLYAEPECESQIENCTNCGAVASSLTEAQGILGLGATALAGECEIYYTD